MTDVLPLPATLPNDANLVEVLVAIDDTNTDRVHVSLHEVSAVSGSAEDWGRYLGEIAKTIAQDWGELIGGTRRPDGNVFAGIVDGFYEKIISEQTANRLVEKLCDFYECYGSNFAFYFPEAALRVANIVCNGPQNDATAEHLIESVGYALTTVLYWQEVSPETLAKVNQIRSISGLDSDDW